MAFERLLAFCIPKNIFVASTARAKEGISFPLTKVYFLFISFLF
jgi:hypothetical protein